VLCYLLTWIGYLKVSIFSYLLRINGSKHLQTLVMFKNKFSIFIVEPRAGEDTDNGVLCRRERVQDAGRPYQHVRTTRRRISYISTRHQYVAFSSYLWLLYVAWRHRYIRLHCMLLIGCLCKIVIINKFLLIMLYCI